MKEKDYLKELEKDYQHWQDVYENGCNDPSWADGVNLNLIRNHIAYDKEQLKQSMPEDELPELFYKDLPPKVDGDYMARSFEIMQNAIRYHHACTEIEEWNTLANAFDFLDTKDPEQESMRFFIRRIQHLKEAIDCMDYVFMQRYKDPTEDIVKIKEYAQRLDVLELNQAQQMSLFSM